MDQLSDQHDALADPGQESNTMHVCVCTYILDMGIGYTEEDGSYQLVVLHVLSLLPCLCAMHCTFLIKRD